MLLLFVLLFIYENSCILILWCFTYFVLIFRIFVCWSGGAVFVFKKIIFFWVSQTWQHC